MSGSFTNDLSSVVPDAVIIEKMELRNHKDIIKDIKDQVSSLVIQESLYLPALICEFTIIDKVNLFEDHQFIGQEKIDIEIHKKPIGSDDTQIFTFTFFITEFPAYQKNLDKDQQSYMLRGTTPFAYLSKFKKISRSYREATGLEVRRLTNVDLEHEDGFVVNGIESSEFRGVFTIQEPLSAIEFMRKNTYDENGAPFFFYQTFDKQVNFSSLSYLLGDTNKSFNTYRNQKSFNNTPQTVEDYKQRAKNLLDISSTLNLSKLFQAIEGAYASRNMMLDYSTKTFTEKIYNYAALDTTNTLGTGPHGSKVLSPYRSLGSDFNTLNNLPDAHQEFLSLNSGAYPTLKNYTQSLSDNIEKLNAYHSLFSTFSHEIELMGDFYLNAGKKITIELPKSIDEEIYKKWKGGDVNNLTHTDEHMSGDYVIVSAIHKFERRDRDFSHMVSLEINKDSFNIDLGARL